MRHTHSITSRLRSRAGYSLVELVVATLAIGILTAGMLALYMGVQRSSADTANRIVNQDDARTAMNLAERYIRMAQSSDSNLTSSTDAVVYAAPQEIVFYADVDGDYHAEKIRYYLSGQSLMMATTEPDLGTSPATYPAEPTTNSIVILNEIFTSTTFKDAAFLCRRILETIVNLDLLCVFVTFVDELASFNEKTVSMVSTVAPENPALRTYKILREPAGGLTYAILLAEKYRLTESQLMERIKS